MWPKEDDRCGDFDFDEECGCMVCPECGRHSREPRIIDVILVPATLGTLELSMGGGVSKIPWWSSPTYAEHPYPSEPRLRRRFESADMVFVAGSETLTVEMTITLGG